MGQRGGPVRDDPQRPPGVLRRRTARLPRPVGRDQPPLRLVRRPLQRRHRPREPALHPQHTAAPRQTCELTRPAAVDDQHLAVVQRLERDRPQQRRTARPRLPQHQQMRLGGPLAGAPEHRRRIAFLVLVAVHHREGPGDGFGVGEPEDRLAGRGDEALRRDVRGQRVQDAQHQLVGRLVPGEVVLPAASGLGVQHLLDTGPRPLLPIGEIRRVLQLEALQPPALVEAVLGEGRRPVAAVGVERAGVALRREVRDQRLVQRLQPLRLGLPGAAVPGAAVPPRPGRRPHHHNAGEQQPVRHQRHAQHTRGDEEEQRATAILGRRIPALSAGRSQPAQSTADGDQRMEHVGGAVGGAARDVSAAREGSAVGQDAGQGSPGHICLLLLVRRS